MDTVGVIVMVAVPPQPGSISRFCSAGIGVDQSHGPKLENVISIYLINIPTLSYISSRITLTI